MPEDKVGVAKRVAGRMLQLALAPPQELLCLPFTAAQSRQAGCFVSLLVRPIVCPEVPGFASILLSGQFRIHFAKVGTSYTATTTFDTVEERFYREAIDVILDGSERCSANRAGPLAFRFHHFRLLGLQVL